MAPRISGRRKGFCTLGTDVASRKRRASQEKAPPVTKMTFAAIAGEWVVKSS
jgi:hypothetical protein